MSTVASGTPALISGQPNGRQKTSLSRRPLLGTSSNAAIFESIWRCPPQPTVRGRSLHLSSAEVDVLVFLTAHRRRLVTSHTKLATRAQAGVCHTEFLPAFLSLRKKLEEEVPGNRYMQTEAWILFDFHPGNEGRP